VARNVKRYAIAGRVLNVPYSQWRMGPRLERRDHERQQEEWETFSIQVLSPKAALEEIVSNYCDGSYTHTHKSQLENDRLTV
jgi:hypothetical protein